jgi:signal transduction histidine kinase
MKVLIVDDREDNRLLLGTLLKGHGHHVVVAVHGAEALERLKEGGIELIVSDILMPVMDGFELCRQVRKDEKLRHIPFIVYTATYTGTEDETFALKIGANRFILKPCEPDTFMQTLSEVMTEAGRGAVSFGPPVESEEEIFKLYNARLVRKLEQKMAQLEQEVRLRQEAEATLKADKAELERLLTSADQSRRAMLSILEDQRAAEEAIRRLNTELELRVQERTARLEALNKELEAFSYSVSHDLRAPLRSIEGFSRALLEDCSEMLDDTGKGYLDRVCKATQHMGMLIDELLKLSRVTRTELHDQPVDLSGMVREIAADYERHNPGRSVESMVRDGVSGKGDPSLIRIAVGNLIDNAWKFTGRQAHGRIEFGSFEKDGETVYYLRDDGAGFDKAYADKLFGTFQRLHTAEEFPGTGIGLATVRRIIARHGGRVWAEGDVGKGATFYFTLP